MYTRKLMPVTCLTTLVNSSVRIGKSIPSSAYAHLPPGQFPADETCPQKICYKLGVLQYTYYPLQIKTHRQY